MDLNTLWFILITVLYTGFFVLEGFDFGVGILLPFLSKKDTERRAMINTIGPHWDGNEVWLLTAGGATFAAFPQWYATMFSGFYLPLFLLLVGLILRGVAFEFRSKDDNPRWRSLWDWCIFAGSLIPALLLGVAFSNLARGVPIDASMEYTGGFFNLLNPYALIGGLAVIAVFALHGAIYLSMKTTDSLLEKAQKTARWLWVPAIVLVLAFLVATVLATDLVSQKGIAAGIVPVIAAASIQAAGYFLSKKRYGWSFVMTCLTIAFSLITVFEVLYPRVMVSSTNPAWSLTIYNASSSDYTLRTMTIVALIFVPIVVAYQAWSYWIFRKRIQAKPENLTY